MNKKTNDHLIKSPFFKGDTRKGGGLNGFTLFELLVSISIIGILTALAVVSYGSMQKKARDARRIQDMELIRKAQEQWYLINNSTYKTNCSSGTAWVDADSKTVFVFPYDPKNVSPYTYNEGVSSCTVSGYCICAKLESATGNSSGSCTWVSPGTGASYCVNNQQ